MERMKTCRLAATIVCIGLLGAAQPRSSLASAAPPAQEGAAQKMVSVPPDVFDQLRRDPWVREVLEEKKLAPEELREAWFSASAVRLGPRTDDLVVRSTAPIDPGDSSHFWIFLSHPHGYRLVLAASARDLRVESHRTQAYNDLSLLNATAAQITTTHLYRQKSEPIR
jgi:hypothetical protein